MMVHMPTFLAHDGTELAFSIHGTGDPVICLAGGPMRDADYLGDLGGLSSRRQLIIADLRGTGRSARPTDVSSYRCDRLIADVEALREHLNLDHMDLLGHSAGANLATLYTAAHPSRIRRIALITPSTGAVGITPTGESRLTVARLRSREPWFGPAYAALQAIVAGNSDASSWEAITAFFYGRWDGAAEAHNAAQADRQNQEAAAAFGAEGAFDASATRAALAACPASVLLLAGEVDVNSPPPVVWEFAELFPNADVVVQPRAGHFPWIDDPDLFVATITAFLE